MPKEQILEIIRREKLFLAEKYQVTDIGVFGSVTRDNQTPESDVDVMVKFSPENNIGLFEYINLAHYLEDKLKRKVDLVTPSSVRPAFRKYILPTVEYL